FIRQPVDSTNPLNIPAGNFFNRPDANNRRFYRDTALPQDNFFNTGTQQTNGSPWAGALTTGIFTSCNIPARSEPAQTQFWGRCNMTDPMQGDPVAENATGYLIRWTQWMLDVKKVDGFRIDAIKHMPSWFYDTFYDGVVYNRRQTPDGRWVIPYSFGESVEGNDFTFDRYIRMPNGRASGRNPAGDAFGNRDALDLNGAGRLRDLIGGGGLGSWSSNNVLNAHIDATDDGFNNGTIGVNHIFSHDNGSNGNGSTPSAIPVDDITVPSWRRRANALPIITGNQFRLKLTTVNGDAGAGNNAAADDNAVFRINQGYQDFNGSGSWDIPFSNSVVPGYEQFVTARQPLADTANTNGLYEQVIDTTQLPEGYN
ncbi:MAG: hypothetical protein ACK5P8_04340, partial [Phycisphaerae bacterium]